MIILQNTGRGVYVNEVWPGEAVYPDFGKPDVRNGGQKIRNS